MKQFSLLVVWFCSTLFAVPIPADEPIRLRVLSYNIHHGEGIDGKLDLSRISRVIRDCQPHLVALQEVDQNATRTGSIDQAKELARLTEMNFVFGANIELQGGHYGNAVLSKFPIVNHQNHLLPNVNEGEQRGVIVAEIDIPKLSDPLLLFATHLDHRRDQQERVKSAKAINELVVKTRQTPALLAGDLNDVVGSDTLSILERHWNHSNDTPMPTIPVTNPKRQIDFVMFRPQEQWKVIEVKILDEAVASDHRAILAVLEFWSR